jgi:presenilin-like A22 family membrane protease
MIFVASPGVAKNLCFLENTVTISKSQAHSVFLICLGMALVPSGIIVSKNIFEDEQTFVS